MSSFENLMQNVRRAANGGIGAMSTGEALAAALVLNRSDWLASMGYTIAEALDRVGGPWVGMLRKAEQAWKAEADTYAQLQEIEQVAATTAALFGAQVKQADTQPVDLSAVLVTYEEAPGYREVSFEFDVSLVGEGKPKGVHRISLRIRPEDGESIMEQILRVHRFAWSNGKPLDKRPNEQQPRWVTEKI